MNSSRLFLILGTTATMLLYQICLDSHQIAKAGAAVFNVEIKRLTKADKLSHQLAEIANSSKTDSHANIKFGNQQQFINNFLGGSGLVLETNFDEVDMPSQLLEDCIRSAVCVPYSSLKPLHLLPIGTVNMTSPAKVTLAFYAGTTDRFSVGQNWFFYSTGPSNEISEQIRRAAPIGADESVLEKNFHIDGGISPKSISRYCLNNKSIEGRVVKINVEIENHKIKRCSPPYIEQAFFD